MFPWHQTLVQALEKEREQKQQAAKERARQKEKGVAEEPGPQAAGAQPSASGAVAGAVGKAAGKGVVQRVGQMGLAGGQGRGGTSAIDVVEGWQCERSPSLPKVTEIQCYGCLSDNRAQVK
jgi:hypothetical protein